MKLCILNDSYSNSDEVGERADLEQSRMPDQASKEATLISDYLRRPTRWVRQRAWWGRRCFVDSGRVSI